MNFGLIFYGAVRRKESRDFELSWNACTTHLPCLDLWIPSCLPNFYAGPLRMGKDVDDAGERRNFQQFLFAPVTEIDGDTFPKGEVVLVLTAPTLQFGAKKHLGIPYRLICPSVASLPSVAPGGLPILVPRRQRRWADRIEQAGNLTLAVSGDRRMPWASARRVVGHTGGDQAPLHVASDKRPDGRPQAKAQNTPGRRLSEARGTGPAVITPPSAGAAPSVQARLNSGSARTRW